MAHSVILYGSKSWVVNGDMLKVLTAFHHQAARYITGVTANRGVVREWEYLAVDEYMEAAGIHLIRVYIKRCQTTISEWVAYCPLICTVHRGRADARDDPYSALVESRRDK